MQQKQAPSANEQKQAPSADENLSLKEKLLQLEEQLREKEDEIARLSQSPGNSPGSPDAWRALDLDAEGFFKEARRRLDAASFDEMLRNIKHMNSKKQCRECTIDQGKKMLSRSHGDLVANYEKILRMSQQTIVELEDPPVSIWIRRIPKTLPKESCAEMGCKLGGQQ